MREHMIGAWQAKTKPHFFLWGPKPTQKGKPRDCKILEEKDRGTMDSQRKTHSGDLRKWTLLEQQPGVNADDVF